MRRRNPWSVLSMYSLNSRVIVALAGAICDSANISRIKNWGCERDQEGQLPEKIGKSKPPPFRKVRDKDGAPSSDLELSGLWGKASVILGDAKRIQKAFFV